MSPRQNPPSVLTLRKSSIFSFGAICFLWWLCRVSLAETQTDIEFGRPDGVSLKLDATLTEGNGPFPTIVFVHGGGFTGGDKKGYPKPIYQKLTAAGFNWFSVNYRLSPKYTFPAHTDDVESAVSFIKTNAQRFKVDVKRIVLMGPSAGGHLVSFVGARHRSGNQVAAVVSMFGEHDLVNRTKPRTDCAIGGSLRHTESPEACLSDGLKAFLGITEVSPATASILHDASPISYVKKGMPPYLLLHGTKDFHVPYEQSVLMRDAMKKAGVPCEIITVQGGGHGGWDNDASLSTYQDQLLRWLKQALRLKAKA